MVSKILRRKGILEPRYVRFVAADRTVRVQTANEMRRAAGRDIELKRLPSLRHFYSRSALA
jgi:hypothetical protein